MKGPIPLITCKSSFEATIEAATKDLVIPATPVNWLPCLPFQVNVSLPSASVIVAVPPFSNSEASANSTSDAPPLTSLANVL